MKADGHDATKEISIRLQTKFLVGILLLISVLMLAIILVVEQQMRDSILDEFLKRGLSVTRNLAATNRDFITTYNYVKIEQNLEHVIQENDLLYAVVVFFDGDIIGAQKKKEITQKVLAGELHERTYGINDILIQYDDFGDEKFCDIAAPIFVKDEHWATIRTGFPLNNMNNAVVRIREVLVGLGFIGLVFGCLASVFLARRITRPVNILVGSIRAISHGEYQQPIKVTTHDEIGYLGHQFAAMKDTIQEQFQLLADANLELSNSNMSLQYEITERRKVEQELRESEARLANAQRIAQVGFWEWDRSKNHLHWSTEIQDIFGIEVQRSNGTYRDLLEFVPTEDRVMVERAINQALEGERRASIEHRIFRSNGSECIVQQEIEASFDEMGKGIRILGTVQDITERKQTEQRIRYLAFYDNVTDLPNRTFLKEHLNHTLARARRDQRISAILFLDLDRFKRINDTLGHSTGDALLQEVARRLSSCVRECDYVAVQNSISTGKEGENDGEHTVARLGGDEFVIVLERLHHAIDAAVVARRVNDALAKPICLGSNEVYVTTSIGISIFPQDGRDAETLLKHADAAMYHAKARGRNRYKFFATSMNADVLKRLSLEANLRNSLENGDFLLHYQPKISIQSGQIIGMEALIRWVHPERGLVPPGEFIPIAEETGLIVHLGKWVLSTACSQAKAWQDAGLPAMRVSVNLSAVQFNQRDLHPMIMQTLNESGLAPHYLELELTESLIMENLDNSIKQLSELSDIGVHLSIDDFGTGYSSLSYLKRFPINSLKIDQCFVRDISENSDDAAIVKATIALGHILRLTVIAEGVEHESQLELLRVQGCDEIQGNLLSKPLTCEDFEAFIRERMYRDPLISNNKATHAC